MSEILKDGYEKKYAIPAFNFDSYDVLLAIFEGTSETQSPLIAQITEPAIESLGLENVVSIVKNEAALRNIPTALHLDHGENLDIIKRCYKAGFTSAMIDFSCSDIEENIRVTREVKEIAEKYGASVESSIGHVGTTGNPENETLSDDESLHTDLNDAIRFYEETKVDALAVSIGSVHGMTRQQIEIDIESLKFLHENIKVPFVLHGSSGVSKESLEKCIEYGIAKTNVETELRKAYRDGLDEILEKDKSLIKPRHIMKHVRELVKEKVVYRQNLLGANGKIKTFGKNS